MDFNKAFLEMFKISRAPDLDMYAENFPLLDRYIGPGEEPFYYSLKMNSSCSEQQLTELIDQEVSLARKRGRKAMEWKVFEWPALPFLNDLLKKKGFQLKRESRVLFTSSDFFKEPKPGISVKEITDSAMFEKLLDIGELAFGVRSEWLNRGLRKEIFERPDCVKAFLAFVENEPASSAWIKFYGNIGFLFGGGTDPKLRGKGAYSALVSARCAFAKSAGIKYIISECSPDSEKVLRALNFRDAGKVYQWILKL